MLYCSPVPVGDVMVMVPVAVVQVGCVTVATAWAGAAGAGFTVTLTGVEIQPSEFCTVTEYVFGTSPLNIGELWYAPPMLYCSPVPVGDVMMMVPVAVVQVGCVTVATA